MKKRIFKTRQNLTKHEVKNRVAMATSDILDNFFSRNPILQ